MTEGMPKKLRPFVTCERSRHGKVVFYFRKDKGKRTRLPDLNAPNFDEKYLAALSATEPQKRAKAGTGSLTWLITRYKDSGAYAALSEATKRQRDNILKGVATKAGHHRTNPSRASRSSMGEKRGRKLQRKPVTISTPCAVCFGGRWTPNWS